MERLQQLFDLFEQKKNHRGLSKAEESILILIADIIIAIENGKKNSQIKLTQELLCKLQAMKHIAGVVLVQSFLDDLNSGKTINGFIHCGIAL